MHRYKVPAKSSQKRRRIEDFEVQAYLVLEPARTALSMGLPVPQVKQAIRDRLEATGRPFVGSYALIEATLNLQTPEKKEVGDNTNQHESSGFAEDPTSLHKRQKYHQDVDSGVEEYFSSRPELAALVFGSGVTNLKEAIKNHPVGTVPPYSCSGDELREIVSEEATEGANRDDSGQPQNTRLFGNRNMLIPRYYENEHPASVLHKRQNLQRITNSEVEKYPLFKPTTAASNMDLHVGRMQQAIKNRLEVTGLPYKSSIAPIEATLNLQTKEELENSRHVGTFTTGLTYFKPLQRIQKVFHESITNNSMASSSKEESSISPHHLAKPTGSPTIVTSAGENYLNQLENLSRRMNTALTNLTALQGELKASGVLNTNNSALSSLKKENYISPDDPHAIPIQYTTLLFPKVEDYSNRPENLPYYYVRKDLTYFKPLNQQRIHTVFDASNTNILKPSYSRSENFTYPNDPQAKPNESATILNLKVDSSQPENLRPIGTILTYPNPLQREQRVFHEPNTNISRSSSSKNENSTILSSKERVGSSQPENLHRTGQVLLYSQPLQRDRKVFDESNTKNSRSSSSKKKHSTKLKSKKRVHSSRLKNSCRIGKDVTYSKLLQREQKVFDQSNTNNSRASSSKKENSASLSEPQAKPIESSTILSSKARNDSNQPENSHRVSKVLTYSKPSKGAFDESNTNNSMPSSSKKENSASLDEPQAKLVESPTALSSKKRLDSNQPENSHSIGKDLTYCKPLQRAIDESNTNNSMPSSSKNENSISPDNPQAKLVESPTALSSKERVDTNQPENSSRVSKVLAYTKPLQRKQGDFVESNAIHSTPSSSEEENSINPEDPLPSKPIESSTILSSEEGEDSNPPENSYRINKVIRYLKALQREERDSDGSNNNSRPSSSGEENSISPEDPQAKPVESPTMLASKEEDKILTHAKPLQRAFDESNTNNSMPPSPSPEYPRPTLSECATIFSSEEGNYSNQHENSHLRVHTGLMYLTAVQRAQRGFDESTNNSINPGNLQAKPIKSPTVISSDDEDDSNRLENSRPRASTVLTYCQALDRKQKAYEESNTNISMPSSSQRRHFINPHAEAKPIPTIKLCLEEENRKLKEARMCKICMDAEIAIVFLPCGHLTTCNTCAASLLYCPLCRCTIKDCVKTFLS